MHSKTVFKHALKRLQQFRRPNLDQTQHIIRSRSFSKQSKNENIIRLADGVLAGDRRALSRAITLIESTNKEHYKQAQLLLTHIYKNKTETKKSFRIGITGPPGAGKSTFVNELGSQLCDMGGTKVCVLPIDPSSFLSKGSILADQTRMQSLFKRDNAYVRPSPNRLSLGGVTDTTFEVCALCESAGFDLIIVETVGVGQSEIEVCNSVDLFLLIITPFSGDDLQGLKRGIIEMSDLIIVNKCEGNNEMSAKHIKADYQRAIGLTHTRRANIGWVPKIVLCSSLSAESVTNVWNEIEIFKAEMESKGEFERCRKQQSKDAMWKYVWRSVKEKIDSQKQALLPIESKVMSHAISPREGSQEILKYIWNCD